MDKKLLAELVQSIKAAGRYVRGEGRAPRVFGYPHTDVKALRERIDRPPAGAVRHGPPRRR